MKEMKFKFSTPPMSRLLHTWEMVDGIIIYRAPRLSFPTGFFDPFSLFVKQFVLVVYIHERAGHEAFVQSILIPVNPAAKHP